MNIAEPFSQKKLFGINNHLLEFIRLYKTNNYPNKILLSGSKGIGKSTLAYHFINYVLSEDEHYKYDIDNFEINFKRLSYKTILNKSNVNLIVINNKAKNKSIDIKQIRDLINNLNKSSFNIKPRFVLIDNIELLNKNSINALLKVLEEPNENVHFILINNNKNILPTLLSRCINYKIKITNKECLEIINQIFDNKLNDLINPDLVTYYSTPGNIHNLLKFADQYKYDLLNLDLKKLIMLIIKENHYKKDLFVKNMLFYLIELYFRKLSSPFSIEINKKYSYFIQKIYDTKNFNLDEESLFIEFNEEILNG